MESDVVTSEIMTEDEYEKELKRLKELHKEIDKVMEKTLTQCSCGWVGTYQDLLWVKQKTTFNHINCEGINYPAAVRVDMEGVFCPQCKKLVLERYVE